MSNVCSLALARKTSRVSLLNTWLSGGTLDLYSGTKPASADTSVTNQVKLVEFTLPAQAGTVANGVFTLGAGTAAGMILADGVPTWARARDSSGVTVGDFTVGGTGSGEAIIIDNTSLIEGALVSLLSMTISEQ